MIATTIADVPTRTVPAVPPDTPATTAAGRLRETGAPALVVVDEGAVVGLVTRAAFLPVVADGDADATVATLAVDPGAVAPDTPVRVAADRMREAGVRRLPVVDAGSPPSVVAASALAPYVPRYRLFGTGPTAGTAVPGPAPDPAPESEPEPDADGTTVSPARRSGGEGPTAAGSTSQ